MDPRKKVCFFESVIFEESLIFKDFCAKDESPNKKFEEYCFIRFAMSII